MNLPNVYHLAVITIERKFISSDFKAQHFLSKFVLEYTLNEKIMQRILNLRYVV